MTIRAGNPPTRTQATAGRGYILAAWIKAIIGRALDAAGGDSSALLAEAGFDLKSLDAPTLLCPLVNTARHSLALIYLSARHHSVSEIPYLLGFSSGSSFTRAFRRWTGQSPSNWRAGAAAS